MYIESRYIDANGVLKERAIHDIVGSQGILALSMSSFAAPENRCVSERYELSQTQEPFL